MIFLAQLNVFSISNVGVVTHSITRRASIAFNKISSLLLQLRNHNGFGKATRHSETDR